MKGDLFFVLEHDGCVLQQGYNRQNRNGITERRAMIFFVIHKPFPDTVVVENVRVEAQIGDFV